MAETLRNILVPVDGSDSAHRAVEFAAMLARATGASLTLLTVFEGGTEAMFELTTHDGKAVDDAVERVCRVRIQSATRGLELSGVEVREQIRVGSPAAEIVAYVDRHKPDLVVLGSRGLSPMKAILAGSVGAKVIPRVSSPVTVVH